MLSKRRSNTWISPPSSSSSSLSSWFFHGSFRLDENIPSRFTFWIFRGISYGISGFGVVVFQPDADRWNSGERWRSQVKFNLITASWLFDSSCGFTFVFDWNWIYVSLTWLILFWSFEFLSRIFDRSCVVNMIRFQPERKIQLWIRELRWEEIVYGRLFRDEDRRYRWTNRWFIWSFWWYVCVSLSQEN